MSAVDGAVVLCAIALLAGCGPQPQSDPKIRQEIFFKCLAAIPKGPEHVVNNDWDEVVAECGSQAYRMSFR